MDFEEEGKGFIMGDSTEMTIEFLRARLLSERSISRTARQRADQLAKRVGFNYSQHFSSYLLFIYLFIYLLKEKKIVLFQDAFSLTDLVNVFFFFWVGYGVRGTAESCDHPEEKS